MLAGFLNWIYVWILLLFAFPILIIIYVVNPRASFAIIRWLYSVSAEDTFLPDYFDAIPDNRLYLYRIHPICMTISLLCCFLQLYAMQFAGKKNSNLIKYVKRYHKCIGYVHVVFSSLAALTTFLLIPGGYSADFGRTGQLIEVTLMLIYNIVSIIAIRYRIKWLHVFMAHMLFQLLLFAGIVVRFYILFIVPMILTDINDAQYHQWLVDINFYLVIVAHWFPAIIGFIRYVQTERIPASIHKSHIK